MSIKYKPVRLEDIDYKREVNLELENGREINALLLIHGYIEAYLLEWLLICGRFPLSKKISNKIVKEIERLGFNNLLHIHFILGNIDESLYLKAKELNEARNKFAHQIINIDISDKETRDEIRKIVLKGIDLCDEIFKLYRRTLDEKSKMF